MKSKRSIVFILLTVLILVFGLYPAPIMDMIHASSSYILGIIGGVL